MKNLKKFKHRDFDSDRPKNNPKVNQQKKKKKLRDSYEGEAPKNKKQYLNELYEEE